VIAISKTRYLTTLTTTTFFGKLREHKLEMTRLKEIKTVEKKSRSLAVKTKAADVESSEESSDECSDTKNVNMLIRRLQKFIKMKGKWRTRKARGITRNLIMVLLNLPVLVVENRDTRKWIVQA